MNYLVSQIVNFITEQDVISDESDVQDFYRYGIEISISSLLNIVLVVIVNFHCLDKENKVWRGMEHERGFLTLKQPKIIVKLHKTAK